MSLLGELIFGKRASSIAGIHPSADNSATWWPRGEESATGLQVSERNSLGHTAVYQAVQLIAGLHAILPCHVLERVGDDRREAREHPLWRLLHEEPNPESSWVQFDQAQMLNKLTYGNRYAEIEYGAGGRNGMRLWHVPSDYVTPRRVYKRPGEGLTFKAADATPEDRRRGGTIVYEVRSDAGAPVYIEAQRMLHVPDMSFNGMVGFSRVRTILESIAVGRARLAAMAALYGNDSTPGGVIERPKEVAAMGPSGVRSLLASWEATHGGVARKGRVAVLQEGATFKPITFSPKDAMVIEAGNFSILEVAQAFNLSPHWLGYNNASQPYANIESEWTALAVRTLLPHVRADESEFRRKLLLPDERDGFFIQYNMKGLLRGDSASRAAFYRALYDMRVVSPNIIAQIEDMERVPAEDGGDDYGPPKPPPAAPPPQLPPPAVKPAEGEDKDDRFRPVLAAAIVRAMGKETSALRKVAARAESVAELREGLGEFYGAHRDFVGKVVGLGGEYAGEYVTRHRGELDAILAGEPVLSQARERIVERLAAWEAGGADEELHRLTASEAA